MKNFIVVFVGVLCPLYTIDMPKIVAHATGKIDRYKYTNSYDSFIYNYNRGCRAFEIDLRETKNGHIIGFHGWGRITPKHKKFMSKKIRNKYLPIDEKQLRNLMINYPDWVLITDIKNNIKPMNTIISLCHYLRWYNIDCTKRIIPFVHNTGEQLHKVNQFGFKKVILSTYKGKISYNDIVQTVQKNDTIAGVAFSRNNWNMWIINFLKKNSVKPYIHSINSQKLIKYYKKKGFYGVITDSQCTKK